MRHWSGRGQERRGSARLETRAGPRRIGEPTHKSLGSPRRIGERCNNPVLQSAPARRGARRGTETGTIADAAEQGPAPSILLGRLHSVRRVGEPRRPPIANMSRIGQENVRGKNEEDRIRSSFFPLTFFCPKPFVCTLNREAKKSVYTNIRRNSATLPHEI